MASWTPHNEGGKICDGLLLSMQLETSKILIINSTGQDSNSSGLVAMKNV